MRNPIVFGLALACTAGGAGCAHAGGAFYRAFDRGDVQEAARIFDSDSALWHDEEALFRTAAERAMPGSPIYDPGRAHALLEQYLTRFPQADHRAEALRLQALLTQVERLSRENRALDRRADSLAARTEALGARLDSAGVHAAEQRRAAFLLEVELHRTAAELRAVRQELARLKAIDLRLSRRKRG